jgi:hypothetical protein
MFTDTNERMLEHMIFTNPGRAESCPAILSTAHFFPKHRRGVAAKSAMRECTAGRSIPSSRIPNFTGAAIYQLRTGRNYSLVGKKRKRKGS